MIEEIAKWLLPGGGLLALGKLWIDHNRAKAPENKAHSATSELIDRLEKQSAEWEGRHNELLKTHAEMAEVISELKKQNALLFLLIKMKGVTDEELAAIGIAMNKANRDAQK